MRNRCQRLAFTCVMFVAAFSADAARTAIAAQPAKCGEPAIVFVSTRDHPTGNPFLTAEIYLMEPDGTNPQRLTDNSDGDAFPALSPSGKWIVFESNRLRSGSEPLNTSDLFLMKVDGSEQTFLTRGSSATWSPDGKLIAFHASASGTGLPIRPDAGAPYADSDIFGARVGELLEDGATARTNSTNTPFDIEEDPDWSPDGQGIVYTRHPASDLPANFNYTSKEIYVMNADGTGVPLQLTFNAEEERAPAWSPDGLRIAYMCRKGDPPTPTGPPTFEICVMDADGTNQTRLTSNAVGDFSPRWSPDGQQIVFSRPPVAGQPQQIWVINAELNADGTFPTPTQLTFPPGINSGPNWGLIKTNCAEGD
jgi:Tol biopolymer transport system component